jgi:hypothetical protein
MAERGAFACAWMSLRTEMVPFWGEGGGSRGVGWGGVVVGVKESSKRIVA